MKPIFTIHEGEFLVGDHISGALGRKYDVWLPTKDMGVDLLVTRRDGKGRPAKIQVKFSRGYGIKDEDAGHVAAKSWFTPEPSKIKRSLADLWVFVIYTLQHERHFVLVPTKELKRRSRGRRGKWNLYLWVGADGSCIDVRGLSKADLRAAVRHGVEDRPRDFTEWLERWDLLDEYTRKRG